MADVIRCDLYDYFEIACMRQYQVVLELLNGNKIEGTATNLKTKQGREWLLLNVDGHTIEVDLKTVDVLVYKNTDERIKISEP